MVKKRPRPRPVQSRRTRQRTGAPLHARHGSPTAVPTGRVEIVDAARGVAIAVMIAYHFCFDLTYYGWASWPMLDDPRWIAWRTSIVTSFLMLAGVSLALRAEGDQQAGRANWFDRAFVVRWSQIATAALLVTAGSLALFPDRFIYFGVLHFVALAIWLCRRAPSRPRLAIGLAALAIAAGSLVSSHAFDPRPLNWLGFAAEKPLTEDYVPLFPWIGVVLVGCGLGRHWTDRGRRLWAPVSLVWRSMPSPLCRGLATMGRWSLTTYLLHQPLMLGAMGLVRRFA